MALALVQSKSGATTANTATTVVANMTSNTTTGNLLVVCVQTGAQANSSVSDGLNTWVLATSDINFSGTYIYYAKAITGATTPAITATFAAAGPGTIEVYEISGADTAAPLDKVISAAGDGVTSNTPTATTAATTVAAEFIVAATGFFSGAGTNLATVGAGYSNLVVTNSTPTTGQNVSGAVESKIVAATGAQTATFGLSFSTTTWEISIATFKQATVTTLPPGERRYLQAVNRAGSY